MSKWLKKRLKRIYSRLRHSPLGIEHPVRRYTLTVDAVGIRCGFAQNGRLSSHACPSPQCRGIPVALNNILASRVPATLHSRSRALFFARDGDKGAIPADSCGNWKGCSFRFPSLWPSSCFVVPPERFRIKSSSTWCNCYVTAFTQLCANYFSRANGASSQRVTPFASYRKGKSVTP